MDQKDFSILKYAKLQIDFKYTRTRFFFPSAQTPNRIFFLFPLGSIFPSARFEPETAGCKARTLPLCYAVPPIHGQDTNYKLWFIVHFLYFIMA